MPASEVGSMRKLNDHSCDSTREDLIKSSAVPRLSAGPSPYLVKEVKALGVVAAAVHGVDGKEAVGRLDEEAAQALDDAGADPDMGAAPVELRLQLRRAQQRRLQKEVVPAHTHELCKENTKRHLPKGSTTSHKIIVVL